MIHSTLTHIVSLSSEGHTEFNMTLQIYVIRQNNKSKIRDIGHNSFRLYQRLWLSVQYFGYADAVMADGGVRTHRVVPPFPQPPYLAFHGREQGVPPDFY